MTNADTKAASNLVQRDSVLKVTEERETSIETMIRHGLSQMALEGKPARMYGGLANLNQAASSTNALRRTAKKA